MSSEQEFNEPNIVIGFGYLLVGVAAVLFAVSAGIAFLYVIVVISNDAIQWAVNTEISVETIPLILLVAAAHAFVGALVCFVIGAAYREVFSGSDAPDGGDADA